MTVPAPMTVMVTVSLADSTGAVVATDTSSFEVTPGQATNIRAQTIIRRN